MIDTKFPADVVVLSACNTGRGRVYETEGLLGLAPAFMLSGASSVVCSLWKVDDDATRALMIQFYRHFNPKDGSKPKSAAESLKLAQAHVRAQPTWKDPYYWAGWILWGTGR